MKGYLETEQAFGKGDIATLDDTFIVRIEEVIEDENGTFWYEVRPIDFDAITREVPQKRLEEA
jgi:hypothetical protein